MRLHKHQVDAIGEAQADRNYVLTTGTGSGKSLSYIIPIVDHVLRNGRGKGIKAIVVYPMNALCNSQYGELEKFLRIGFGEGKEPVRFERYTGQETREKREEITRNPPDILLTNYVMLELLLTRPFEQALVNSARGLRFLVLDELHTYRGRQGADVALLVRRVREACHATQMLCVGTSATMASGGNYEEQRTEIASVASRLFGTEVKPESIIGETLKRESPELKFADAGVLQGLKSDIAKTSGFPSVYANFIESPMACWLEDCFGLTREVGTNRLIRATPKRMRGDEGAATQLSALVGMPADDCEDAIERWLLAGCNCEPHPETNRQPFAFRLHQFISRGDAVFASLEENDTRHLSISGQQFVPGSKKSKILLPLAFCRECGAEYYSVWKYTESSTGRVHFRTRDLNDRVDDPEEGEAGFLYHDPENLWPNDPDNVVVRVPEDWLEEHRGRMRVRSNRRDDVPQPILISPDGTVSADGLMYAFTNTPFRFCQHCGVSYRVRRGSSDYGQLATLASGGRSTATTILSLTSVRFLREEPTLQDFARKLLSFTDNRQDASLQAGHFNDFVEVSLLRSALYKAVATAGSDGIAHDELTQRVYKALDLPLELFAREPGVQFAQRADTERAFRNVLGYRLYRDQKRGWRITSPNLEQCGLLKIEYPSLMELCQSEDHWQGNHAALTGASPATRERVSRALLDYLRRELAIDVDYLTTEFFERLQQQSSQRLREPWAIDEQERAEIASAVFPRGRRPHDRQFYTYLSGRSGFGIYLGRPTTLPELDRVCGNRSVFDVFPYTIVSLDYIKSESRRDDFIRACPELVIVDEAHTCTSSAQPGRASTRQQRHEVVKALAEKPDRHILLVTATPHSGNEEGFRSLLGLLNPEFAELPTDLSGEGNRKHRERLARYFVQRRRGDIRHYLESDTSFPDRLEQEKSYKLGNSDYRKLFDRLLNYAREVVEDSEGMSGVRQRVRWWAALALLRALPSSPAAAAATLRNKLQAISAESPDEVDEISRPLVFDDDTDDSSESHDIVPGADIADLEADESSVNRERKRLLDMARAADKLEGDGDPKLLSIIPIVKTLVSDGSRPILFCRFIATAEYVAEQLRQKLPKSVQVIAVTGQIPPAEREQRIAELRDHDKYVLVCTDCLSEGINLQHLFDSVIHYDLSWNPTRHEQREGRVDRFGQPKPEVKVMTYYGTDNQIDGVVLEVLIDKHKRIRKATGVSVPVPTTSNAVLEALYEGLLLRRKDTQQQLLPFEDDEETKPMTTEFNEQWQNAADREKPLAVRAAYHQAGRSRQRSRTDSIRDRLVDRC